MTIYLDIPSVKEVVEKLGIGPNGRAQLFHTQNVLRHMLPYMPMDTGMLATKLTMVASSTSIVTNAPYAQYVYYGNRMVNSKTGKGPRYIPGVGYRWPKGATLVPTTTPLNYTTTFHPLAGPRWDERMVAADGDVIAKELEMFIRSQS